MRATSSPEIQRSTTKPRYFEVTSMQSSQETERLTDNIDYQGENASLGNRSLLSPFTQGSTKCVDMLL